MTHSDSDVMLTAHEPISEGFLPRSVTLWMAIIYIALFVIRPWEKLMPELAEIRFERTYAIAMIAAVLLSFSLRIRANFQTFTVLLFLGVVTYSAMVGMSFDYSWYRLWILITLVIFFFIISSVVRTPYQLVIVVLSYVVIMWLYLGKSQWEYFFHSAHEFEQGVRRLRGIDVSYGDPNSLAPTIVFSLPFVFFLFATKSWFSDHWPIWAQKFLNLGLILYLPLAGTSILLTRSRTGVVCLLAFLILQSLKAKNFASKFGLLVSLGIFCLVTFLFLPSDMQKRIQSMWYHPDGVDISAQGRWDGFLAGVEIFKQKTLTGVGIGNFAVYRRQYVDGSSLEAHNLFGQVLGETGLLGTSAFVLLIMAMLLNCRRVRLATRFNDDPESQMFFRFSTACRDIIILMFVSGLFGHNLYRFNWFWIAAFAMLAAEFVRKLDDSDS